MLIENSTLRMFIKHVSFKYDNSNNWQVRKNHYGNLSPFRVNLNLTLNSFQNLSVVPVFNFYLKKNSFFLSLQIMNKQRQTGEFCDITVLVEHQRFSAHKSVLAANSIYFKNLLATGNDGIFLHHITAESFAAILDFMYTSRLHLEPYSVQDILSASKFLQVKGVISICCRSVECYSIIFSVIEKVFKNKFLLVFVP